jgi:hypothetical protein
MTAIKIAFLVVTAATNDDPVDVGIYDSSGTQICHSGNQTGLLNSTGVKVITIPTTNLKADTRYYAAIAPGAVGGTAAGILATAFVSGNADSDIMGTTIGTREYGIQNGSSPLPAGPVTLSGGQVPILAVRES